MENVLRLYKIDVMINSTPFSIALDFFLMSSEKLQEIPRKWSTGCSFLIIIAIVSGGCIATYLELEEKRGEETSH